jgi:hypothetical protein
MMIIVARRTTTSYSEEAPQELAAVLAGTPFACFVWAQAISTALTRYGYFRVPHARGTSETTLHRYVPRETQPKSGLRDARESV